MEATYTIRISENSANVSSRWYWEIAGDGGSIVARGLSASQAAAREEARDTVARIEQASRQQQSEPWSLSA